MEDISPEELFGINPDDFNVPEYKDELEESHEDKDEELLNFFKEEVTKEYSEEEVLKLLNEDNTSVQSTTFTSTQSTNKETITIDETDDDVIAVKDVFSTTNETRNYTEQKHSVFVIERTSLYRNTVTTTVKRKSFKRRKDMNKKPRPSNQSTITLINDFGKIIISSAHAASTYKDRKATFKLLKMFFTMPKLSIENSFVYGQMIKEKLIRSFIFDQMHVLLNHFFPRNTCRCENKKLVITFNSKGNTILRDIVCNRCEKIVIVDGVLDDKGYSELNKYIFDIHYAYGVKNRRIEDRCVRFCFKGKDKYYPVVDYIN